MSKQDYTLIIIKSFLGELSISEQEFLDSWLAESNEHQQLFNEMKISWEQSDDYKKDMPIDVNGAWEKVQSKIYEKQSASIIPLWKRSSIRIAASIILLIGLGFLFMNRNSSISPQLASINYNTSKGEVKTVQLSDGSEVILNELTTLTVNDPFTIRNVKLSGEALFKVQHDAKRPFVVQAANTQTLVLGTTFNIKTDLHSKNVEVYLKEGSVEFQSEDKKIKLKPGEAAHYNAQLKNIEKQLSKDINLLSWQTKQLKFDQASMKTVVEDLEDYFNLKIELKIPEDNNCQFTGSFDKPTFKEVIDILAFTFDMKSQEVNGTTLFEITDCK